MSLSWFDSKSSNPSTTLGAIAPTNMTYTVYILRTSANTLYIGQTNNLNKRLQEHRNKTSRSARYIRYFQSFELVYSETYPSRQSAMKREWQLKQWPRAKKEALFLRQQLFLVEPNATQTGQQGQEPDKHADDGDQAE